MISQNVFLHDCLVCFSKGCVKVCSVLDSTLDTALEKSSCAEGICPCKRLAVCLYGGHMYIDTESGSACACSIFGKIKTLILKNVIEQRVPNLCQK